MVFSVRCGLRRDSGSRSNTHSQLYPGGAKLRRAAVERFHELTRCINTSLPLPESLLHSRAGEITALVEFNVWQAGDVGLASLHARFRLAVQQVLQLSLSVYIALAAFEVLLLALCDLVTEFGLLSSPIFDIQAPFSPILFRAPAGSVSSKVRDGMLSSSSEETNFMPAYVNCQFANVARDWFDHMVSEVKNNTEQQFSLKKHMFHLDSDHSARKICKVISERLRVMVCHETVTVCHQESNGSTRYCSLNCSDSFVQPFSSDDGRVVDSEHVAISLMLIAYDHEYAEATLRYGAECLDGLLPEVLTQSRLLREIGLHKMGITHLPATISPSSNALVWLNAPLLYKYDFPEMGAADFDQQFVSDLLEPNEARLRMKLYRHSSASFLAINLMPTFLEDQCEQILM
uniref:Uncharacterized protein n=1 Tax=Parascaris equorum TaxID=6256 RepID=A0A914RRB2_PAREQ